MWDILKETDRDPNNSDNVILIYTGWSVNAAQEYNSGSGWSREHVWAKSHGSFGTTPPAGTDAHHLRPCDISVNSSRGNKDFDNGGTQNTEATECYSDADSWEPRPSVKGDVARMMFYMATRYEGDVAGEPDLELVDYTGTSGPLFGKLSTLIKWNEEDPVDNFERNRNEIVFSYQHNRNPFIDHPEYVNAIYQIANNAPSIENQTFSISENSVINTIIDTVIASDPDYDSLTYNIVSGNNNNAFKINNLNGILYVNNSDAINYETNSSFNLNIGVSDDSVTSNAIITINVINNTAINSIYLSSDISIFPNPVTNKLNVDMPKDCSIDIFSSNGNKILSTKKQQINLQMLNTGIYFVIVKNKNGKTIINKQIIKK